MSATVSLFFIVTTTFSVMNGKTIDKIEYSVPTSYSSYSECNVQIKHKKNKYKLKRKENRDRYAYIYKTIRCKKKKVLDFSGLLKF